MIKSSVQKLSTRTFMADDHDFESDLSAILSRARSGNSEAEEALHREFVGRLVRLASQRINKRFQAKIDADEVVQSVFVSFFRRNAVGEFQVENWNDLWALLVTITLRKCSTKVTSFMTAKRNVSLERTVAREPGESSLSVAASEPSPLEIATFNESLDQLFDLLTPLQQEIVTLRLKGYSNVEISQKIGRTERTVYRSLDKVRDVFLKSQ
jgi:RNA polymerase sigma-70 factor (ECF subfamily)